jgi:paraquat-inducible protein B
LEPIGEFPLSDAAQSDLPRPIIKPMRWPVWLIWIVPIAAGIIAFIYYHDYRQDHAKEIIIHFSNAEGVKAGETIASHLGVEIGTVSSLELSSDWKSTLVHVQLHKSAEDIAKQGTIFWIERAELSAQTISGLTTMISGPYIDCIPGNGPPAGEFQGADEKPIIQGPGLRILVRSGRLQQVQRNSPIYFRGIQVGVVEKVALNQDASGVEIHLFIRDRYRALVRASSKFWIEKGIDFSGGLFSGVKMNVESLRALISGGIAFATPDAKAAQAQEGQSFPLNDEMKKDWQEWKPQIPLPPESSDDQTIQEGQSSPVTDKL